MKPSERIEEIHKALAYSDPISELMNIDGPSDAAVKAIIQYLDEQAESQESKAFEEEALHRSVCNCQSKNCFRPEPQEEPKKFCDEKNCTAKDDLIPHSHKKETEPKEETDAELDRLVEGMAPSKQAEVRFFIKKVIESAREEVMSLPCMQHESTRKILGKDTARVVWIEAQNDLRRELRDTLQSK